jgi:hypothetical protein
VQSTQKRGRKSWKVGYEVVKGTAGAQCTEERQEELAGEYEVVEGTADVEYAEERWDELECRSMRSLREQQAQSAQKKGEKVMAGESIKLSRE